MPALSSQSAAAGAISGLAIIGALLAGGMATILGMPLSMMAVALAAVLVLVVIGLQKPWLLPGATLFSIMMPWPYSVPLAKFVFGIAIYVFDLLLPLAFLTALRARDTRTTVPPALLAYLTVMIAAAGVGLAHTAPLGTVLRELRPPIYLFMGFSLGWLLVTARHRSLVPRVVGTVLWVSVLGILISAVTGLDLVGGTVSSPLTGVAGFNSNGPNRFQIQSTPLALMVLSICICLLITAPKMKRRSLLGVLALGVPAFGVVFFSFARHSLLAVGVALIVALAVTPRRSRLLISIPTLVLVGILVIVPLAATGTFSSETATRQIDAFTERVIQGLSRSAFQKDLGIELRRLETKYALETFRRNPVMGLGLGTNYRPTLPEVFDVFPDGIGETYIHNAYLWYLAKTGLVGTAAFGAAVLGPLAAAFRKARRSGLPDAGVDIALGSAVLGFLAANAVAPYLWDFPGALMVGGIVGFLAHSAKTQEVEETGSKVSAGVTPTPGRSAPVGP